MHSRAGRARMVWLVHSVLVFTLLTDDSERDDTPKAGGVRVKNITPPPLLLYPRSPHLRYLLGRI